MVKAVFVARREDGLPLTASFDEAAQSSLESDFPGHRDATQAVLKSLRTTQSAPLLSVAASDGRHVFHVYAPAEGAHTGGAAASAPVADGLPGPAAFVALCDRGYPKALAYGMLAAVAAAFSGEYDASAVYAAARPYAFVRFDGTLRRLRRSWQDAREQQNLQRLQDELLDVSRVMTTSIGDVLERGGKLESMALLSGALSEESRRYLRATKRLNLALLWRTYGPLVLVSLAVALVIYVYVRFL